MAREAVADVPDALFISCTNLPTYDVIPQLEAELRMPVLSANQVTMWAALRRIGKEAVGPYQALLDPVARRGPAAMTSSPAMPGPVAPPEAVEPAEPPEPAEIPAPSNRRPRWRAPAPRATIRWSRTTRPIPLVVRTNGAAASRLCDDCPCERRPVTDPPYPDKRKAPDEESGA